MTSALYVGRVRHTRRIPRPHDFSYRVYYGLFDVDDLDGLDGRLRLLAAERLNLFSLRRVDHGATDGSPWRPWAERMFASAGVHLDGGRVMLLAFPRVLGYAFNPISVWYGLGPGGDLRGVLYEVRNTFGHRHTYVVPVARLGTRHGAPKQLHVSPFNDMDERYRFTVSAPGERLTLAIDQFDRTGAPKFRAGMSLTRLPLTDRNLLRLFVTHPLLTLKVIGGIHWHALRLWLKGMRYRPVPAAPADEATIVTEGTVVR